MKNVNDFTTLHDSHRMEGERQRQANDCERFHIMNVNDFTTSTCLENNTLNIHNISFCDRLTNNTNNRCFQLPSHMGESFGTRQRFTQNTGNTQTSSRNNYSNQTPTGERSWKQIHNTRYNWSTHSPVENGRTETFQPDLT